MSLSLKDEIYARGLIKQETDDKLFDLYDQGGQTLYYGMDPTADSLHLGNFVGFMHALQYMKRGNTFICIVGGATGMIGDPGGKNAERVFLDEEILKHNVQKIHTQIERILANITEISGQTFDFKVINNLDFYRDMSYLDFLRKVGKHITVNSMMKKETVKRRLETDDQSISYTEFSYMLIQGYDFVRLFEDHDCKLQIAGSDQWGNVVTGIELIRKLTNQEAYGVTTPLILDSTGKKFGKSEGNALWLSPEKNSPYIIYQYFMNVTDEDIERYMKIFSLLSLEDIDDIIKQHQQDPQKRYGQVKLAYLVTQIIFGQQAAEHAVAITELLFGQADKLEQIKHMDAKALQALNQATGGTTTKEQSIRIADLCTLTGLTSSNGEAKKMLKEGVIYVNEQQIKDSGYEVHREDASNNIILLRKGKKQRKTLMFI